MCKFKTLLNSFILGYTFAPSEFKWNRQGDIQTFTFCTDIPSATAGAMKLPPGKSKGLTRSSKMLGSVKVYHPSPYLCLFD